MLEMLTSVFLAYSHSKGIILARFTKKSVVGIAIKVVVRHIAITYDKQLAKLIICKGLKALGRSNLDQFIHKGEIVSLNGIQQVGLFGSRFYAA